ncbi:MAG: hypothetical protein P8013_15020 [Candidatus Sulfobium sp.]
MSLRSTIISTKVIIVSILLGSSLAIAWDNEVTHRDLSESAATRSVIGTTNCLESIGLQEGLLHFLINKNKGQEAYKWLREGAFLEDAGAFWQTPIGRARYNNHFHNPLNRRDEAGLDDVITIWNPVPPFEPVINITAFGESAVLWAQDGAKQQIFPAGDQSWQRTRDHYYKALTLTMETDREAEFAQMFLGLGHQMHLLQDVAVPSHVRNDAHPEDSLIKINYLTGDYYFETWAKANSPLISGFAANPLLPKVDLTIKDPAGLVPITRFYDTDQYNENVLPSDSLTWGLSEYTNANFASDDTIFTESFSKNDRHYFPYPRYSNQVQCYEEYDVDIAPDKKRTYWRKKCPGEATFQRPIDHFVVPGPLFKYLPTWDLQRLTLKLDGATHYDYARRLIPRAVGYSAALLNYFFRGDIRLSYVTEPTPGYVIVNNTDEDLDGTFGIYYDNKQDERILLASGRNSTYSDGIFDLILPADAKEPGKYIVVFKGKMGNEEGAVAGYVFNRLIDITPPSQYVYSMADASQSDPQFTSVKVKIRNSKPSESIQSGVIEAIAKYKTDVDDPDFLYSISEPQTVNSLASDKPTELDFDFQKHPIPVDITDLYLYVIFKGKVGGEDNAVAIGIKDIGEPTPIDIFNDTDRACINGEWYEAGSTDAISHVDTNENGIADEWDIYPHEIKNIYVKFSALDSPEEASADKHDLYLESIGPGQSSRVSYILVDYQFKYSVYESWGAWDQNDPWMHSDIVKTYTGSAVKSQSELVSDTATCDGGRSCYITYYPTYYPFQDTQIWWGAGTIFMDKVYPAGGTCPGILLKEE